MPFSFLADNTFNSYFTIQTHDAHNQLINSLAICHCSNTWYFITERFSVYLFHKALREYEVKGLQIGQSLHRCTRNGPNHKQIISPPGSHRELG
jgi:hypothetical protein